MQLKFYLRAVANAILDHKMHCDKDDRRRSAEVSRRRRVSIRRRSAVEDHPREAKLVQLSTYFVGRMAHYRLRQQIERELGDKFDLGRYHEAVLDHGSVPVKYLPELVRARLSQPR